MPPHFFHLTNNPPLPGYLSTHQNSHPDPPRPPYQSVQGTDIPIVYHVGVACLASKDPGECDGVPHRNLLL